MSMIYHHRIEGLIPPAVLIDNFVDILDRLRLCDNTYDLFISLNKFLIKEDTPMLRYKLTLM